MNKKYSTVTSRVFTHIRSTEKMRKDMGYRKNMRVIIIRTF